jgi:hypothetical protein
MPYKIVRDDYLMHFNKNHSKANGQFVSGDGDADGIVDDHHHYSNNKSGATSGSNIKPKKKGVFSDSGKGRALKRGVIATSIVVGLTVAAKAGEMYINSKYNSGFSDFGSYSDSGSDFVRASKAKVIGGDW